MSLQNWQIIDSEEKQAAEKRCVDVLFDLSELHDIESIEDHLYISSESTANAPPATAATAGNLSHRARSFLINDT